jgi:hypothetical protein
VKGASKFGFEKTVRGGIIETLGVFRKPLCLNRSEAKIVNHRGKTDFLSSARALRHSRCFVVQFRRDMCDDVVVLRVF